MVLHDFQGQPFVIRALLNAIRLNRLAHAYLFVGPRGIGKKDVALRLAQALNCENPQQGDGCGVCRACVNIQQGNHPDVIVIEPSGASIGIDAVRGVIRELVYRPFEGRQKVYIFDRADTMTTEAANSLLKGLEEPPDYVTLILLTDHPQALLPTILSRVQKAVFREVDRESIIEDLQRTHGVSLERARFYAALARGNPGEARTLVESETVLDDRQLALQLLADLKDGPDDMVAFDGAQNVSERGRAVAQFLDLFLTLARDVDLLIVDSDHTGLVNSDIRTELLAFARDLSPESVAALVRLTQDAQRALDAYANTLLVCEVYFIKVRRALRHQLSLDEAYLIEPYRPQRVP